MSASPDLMKISLSIMSKKECDVFYGDISKFDGMLCAGSYMDGGNDTCQVRKFLKILLLSIYF